MCPPKRGIPRCQLFGTDRQLWGDGVRIADVASGSTPVSGRRAAAHGRSGSRRRATHATVTVVRPTDCVDRRGGRERMSSQCGHARRAHGSRPHPKRAVARTARSWILRWQKPRVRRRAIHDATRYQEGCTSMRLQCVRVLVAATAAWLAMGAAAAADDPWRADLRRAARGGAPGCAGRHDRGHGDAGRGLRLCHVGHGDQAARKRRDGARAGLRARARRRKQRAARHRA